MLRTCLQAGRIEAGCDEAGRGPLAGPVAAAAVILPEGWNHPLLNDTKKMSEKNRYLLRETIEREAVAWAVEMVSPEEIDRINILNASFAAMSRAVARLKVVPQMLLIDGNRFRTSLDIPYECIVKGDATFDFDRRRLGSGKNLPGRLHEPDRGGISGLQLEKEQGLSDPRAPRSRHAVRALALSQAILQQPFRPAGSVRRSGASNEALTEEVRHPDGQTGRTAGRCPTNGRAKRRSAEKPERRKLQTEKNTSRTDLTSIQDGLRTSASKKNSGIPLDKGVFRIVYLFRKRHGRRRSDSPPLSDHPIELFTFSPRFARYSVRAKTEL